MADEKLTALTEMTAPALDDLTYAVDDPAGVPASRKIEMGRFLALLAIGEVQGRLTFTSGTPVTTSDVTAAGTLYFTPYNGNLVALYDGSAWDLYSFTERSIAVPGTTDTNYDVFLYDNAGTLTLELTAWTNDTTRATALTTQDGVYVRTGATTRRYLGTFRTTGVAGEAEDSESARLLWNYYNRVQRALLVIDTTDSWNYNVAAWRSANNSAANRFEVLVGIAENPLVAVAVMRHEVGAGVVGSTGIGIDSTAANSAQLRSESSGTEISQTDSAHYSGILAAGYHYVQWLEYARAGNPTFYGDSGVVTIQSGMMGMTEG